MVVGRYLASLLLALFGTGLACAQTAPSGYSPLGFDALADYTIDVSVLDAALTNPTATPPTVDPQIPARVWTWQGKKVEVVGFMMPVRFNGDKVTEFMLFGTPSACCYGVTPRLNEWINVKVPKGTEARMDIPLAVRGKFTVGTRFEEGYVIGVYHLDFESMADAPSGMVASKP